MDNFFFVIAMDEMSLLMEWLCVWLEMFVNEKAFVKDECISVQLLQHTWSNKKKFFKSFHIMFNIICVFPGMVFFLYSVREIESITGSWTLV